MRGLTTKYLLRRAMADRLPASVLQGKKRGFNVPMPSWLAGGLRDFTRDVLGPARLRRQGLFEPAAVDRLVQDHLAKRADHSRAIWTLLVLSVWQDEMLRDLPPVSQRLAGASA
jgi:asparagine synthase (glutamine-hydrolysing)